jgi:sec-independent protein translocase protein TatA
MPGWIGPWEIAILLVIVLLVFGPKRLPEMGRSLGRGMREFKNSITGKDEREEIEAPAAQPPSDGKVEELSEQLRVERRERLIDRAIHEGRFGPDEADDYRRLYDAEPDSTIRTIEKLPARATSSESAS